MNAKEQLDSARKQLQEAVKVIDNLREDGYDIEALANASPDCDPEEYRNTIGPAYKFWDELPRLANGTRALLNEDMLYLLDKDTLVTKTKEGFKLL